MTSLPFIVAAAVAGVCLAIVLRLKLWPAIAVLALSLLGGVQLGASVDGFLSEGRGTSGNFERSNVNHLRLEITLRVDGELITGSTVQAVYVAANWFPGGTIQPLSQRFRGEALFIEMPGRPTFVSTLHSEKGGEYQRYARCVLQWERV